ncbi:MAG: hypothetical protein O2923_08125 [Verrucomicrobia bacterium]|nr:hypothetical protein [Verrucomicrobiota bacterium]MDA1088508.1 hypothetical protein [Verrucomicrobiota bacterium]
MKSRQLVEGFTIAEVMVASAIFLMVSAGFTWAYLTALSTHRMAANHHTATRLAKNQIQRARSLDYDSLQLLSEDSVSVDGMGNVTTDGLFKRSISVDTNAVANCTLVRVSVWFSLGKGRMSDEPVEVASLLTDGL